jgi:hypothetical protein
MMHRLRHRVHREEHGAAIAIVMLVGVVLVLLSSIMIARGYRQLVNTAGDTHWDNALFAAESGLDDALLVLDYDFDYTTGQTVPLETLGSEGERAWAVTAADAAPASEVVSITEGEYVVVRPANSTVVFAVGYSPTRASAERRVRVIRASVEGTPWDFKIEHALLVGDDLELSGGTIINDINDNDGAAVHANGTVIGTGSYSVEGCLSSSETTFAATAQCPPSPAPPEPMPVVDPLVLYGFAEYVMCDNRQIYGGPAHLLTPDPDLVPCNGNETVAVLVGWTSSATGGKVAWSAGPAAVTPGVFYIDNGNYVGKLGSNSFQLQATVIAASTGGDCLIPSTGNIMLDGPSDVVAHPSLRAAGYDLLFVAQGDVQFSGSAVVGGAILAHEQIDYRGGAGSWGAVVAEEACDTSGSPVSQSVTTGTSVINFDGPINTPFTANRLRAEVTGWYEL